MAVSLAGAWGTALSHTAESGSDRILIFIPAYESSSTRDITSVTYGGQAMTKVAGASAQVGTTTINGIWFWYLLEAGIAAAADATFSVTWSPSAPSSVFYAHAFFTGADQASQPLDSQSASAGSGTSLSTSALASGANGMAVAAITTSNACDVTFSVPGTAGNEQDLASATLASAHGATNGSSITPAASVSVDSRMVMGAVSITAAGAAAFANPFGLLGVGRAA